MPYNTGGAKNNPKKIKNIEKGIDNSEKANYNKAQIQTRRIERRIYRR